MGSVSNLKLLGKLCSPYPSMYPWETEIQNILMGKFSSKLPGQLMFKSTVPAALTQSLNSSPQRLSLLPKNLPKFRKESQAKIHSSSLILLAMGSPRYSLPPVHHCAYLHWGHRRTRKYNQPWLTWVKMNPGIQAFSHPRTPQKLKVTIIHAYHSQS